MLDKRQEWFPQTTYFFALVIGSFPELGSKTQLLKKLYTLDTVPGGMELELTWMSIPENLTEN